MVVGDTFTHQGVEYTVTDVNGTEIKGVQTETITEVHSGLDHGGKRMRRICIEEGDITP